MCIRDRINSLPDFRVSFCCLSSSTPFMFEGIEMLKTHKLFNQLPFHTVKVIPLLKFTESIEAVSYTHLSAFRDLSKDVGAQIGSQTIQMNSQS